MTKSIVAISPDSKKMPHYDIRKARNFKASKRAGGRFYTKGNPFDCEPFRRWATLANTTNDRVLEPFAGGNNLIKMLKDISLCKRYAAFDIVPGARSVQERDTLADFPQGYQICVTNPPWLARNSATRRGLPFPDTIYDDLYKHCLSVCLQHCDYVAALVPESYIRSAIFTNRLRYFISLTTEMFAETEHPVALALFVPRQMVAPIIYGGRKKLGMMHELQKHRPPESTDKKIIFNAPQGNLGLLALDNNQEASIRFCPAEDLGDYEVRHSCRAITKIQVSGSLRIADYNDFISDFRKKTWDVFLTAYRGLRKDGRYRRRLDYALARDIISHVGY